MQYVELALAALLVVAFIVVEALVRRVLNLPMPADEIKLIVYADPTPQVFQQAEARLAEAGGALLGNLEAGCFSVPVEGGQVDGWYDLDTYKSYAVHVTAYPPSLTQSQIEAAVREYAPSPPT